ncbi:MAG: hypothetical protein WAM97_15560 [Acidimicrobiales bacterium]|jgi:hypothetical protein
MSQGSTPRGHSKVAIVVLVAVTVAIGLLVVNVRPAAASSGPGDPQFAGYEISAQQTTTESASVTVNVPKIYCVRNSNRKERQYFFLFQELTAEGGDSWAQVVGQCHLGEETYVAEGIACTSYSGCSTCPVDVAYGDSVTLSEDVGALPDSDIGASVDDTTSNMSTSCLSFDAGSNGGNLYTGSCAIDYTHNLFVDSRPNPGQFCGPTQVLPFSKVSFTNATLNGEAFQSGENFNMTYNGRVEVNTGKLKDGGESFNELYV